jgi:UDP-N-acetylglucosamine transferase subunit ALG13
LAQTRGLTIVAQTCEEGATYPHLDARPHLGPAEFESLAREATLIVGHAGIGTILTARRCAKPLIVMPRRASLGEHRNEHQLATVAALGDRAGIYIAEDESFLDGMLAKNLVPLQAADSPTRSRLLGALSNFIANGTL